MLTAENLPPLGVESVKTNSELRKFFGDKNNWKYKKYVREIPQLLEEYA